MASHNTDVQSKEIQALLSVLNPRQREAVTAPLGPVLVLAGAGSGKTKVLTSRIAYLVETKQFEPHNILAITFTNKAAKEMQLRVGAVGATMGTFHSVCARILRHEIAALGYSRSFTIYDDDDQARVLKEVCAKHSVPARFSPNLFRSYISTAKNLLQTPDQLSLGIDPVLLNLTRSIYTDYQNYLLNQNALDFDDLLMLTALMLQRFPAVLAKYQGIFKYVLVDEYQDTNHAQYVLLYLLAVGEGECHGSRNLFVVGDDAQAIYGFRGSNLKNILDFERHFPDAKVIKLEQNYRSTKNILDVAQQVIDLNSEQKPKKLWTENASGEKIQVIEVRDEVAEARFVAASIVRASTPKGTTGVEAGDSASDVTYVPDEQPGYDVIDDAVEEGSGEASLKPFSILDHFLKQQATRGGRRRAMPGEWDPTVPILPAEHGDLARFAVLYRTHAQSRAIEEAFLRAQIPYQIIGGVKFYQRKEIKDVLAYLRLVVNPRDIVSLQRAINEPPRGIGERSLQPIKDFLFDHEVGAAEFASVHAAQIGLGARQLTGAKSFFTMLSEFAALDPAGTLTSLIRLVTKKSGYEEALRAEGKEGESRWENVEEIFNVAQKYDNLPWRDGLDDFLEEVALMTDADTVRGGGDSVTMMSLHQAKGLEFDTVFLTGLEEGILPHSRSLLNPEELSEEVRLAYVGITRARQKLFLLYAQSRRMYGTLQGSVPSRILKALPEDKVSRTELADF